MRFEGSIALMFAAASQIAAQSSLTGIVREDLTLQPLGGVEIAVVGTDQSARTGSDGRFALRSLPSGQHIVSVRSVGFVPLDVALDLSVGAQERVFYLKRLVPQLDTVSVAGARPRGIGREAFEERRKLGLGKFIDSATLRRQDGRSVADLLRDVGGVRIVRPPRCDSRRRPTGRPDPLVPPWCDDSQGKRVAVSASATVGCPMLVVLDGVTLYRPPAPGSRLIEWERTHDLNLTPIADLESVEVYRRTSETPAEFGGGGASCGVLVLWTRRR